MKLTSLSLSISSGIISATSNNAESYGIAIGGQDAGTRTITGGTITGSMYGIYLSEVMPFSQLEITLTKSLRPIQRLSGETTGIYGNNGVGSVNFYDGVLRGGIKSYTDGIITATPDATTIHTEPSQQIILKIAG